MPGGLGEIPGKREAGQRRERQVVRLPDPGVEHPAHPGGDTLLDAVVMRGPGGRESTERRRLHRRHAAGPEPHGEVEILLAPYRLVQADRRREDRLQTGVAGQVRVSERLLDEVQAEGVQFLQPRDILEPVGSVRIHRECEIGEAFPHGPDRLQIVTGPDLELHPRVPAREVRPDRPDELPGIRAEPEAHTYAQRPAGPPEEFPEGESELPRLEVPECSLERGLRRRVSPHGPGERPEILRARDLGPREPRQEEFLKDMPRGLRRLVGVGGILPGRALSPSLLRLRALGPD